MNAPQPAHLFVKGDPRAKAGGRKVGSRTLLADRFFKDLYGLWEEQGDACIRRALFENPVAVLQVVAKLMPAKLEISTPTNGLTDERFAQLIELAEERIASMTIEGHAVSIEGGGGSPRAGDVRGEVIDLVHYSPAHSDPVNADSDPVSEPRLSSDPDFAAGPPGGPPSSSSALSPDEDDVDPSSLF